MLVFLMTLFWALLLNSVFGLVQVQCSASTELHTSPLLSATPSFHDVLTPSSSATISGTQLLASQFAQISNLLFSNHEHIVFIGLSGTACLINSIRIDAEIGDTVVFLIAELYSLYHFSLESSCDFLGDIQVGESGIYVHSVIYSGPQWFFASGDTVRPVSCQHHVFALNPATQMAQFLENAKN
ncbi:hypothetical protein ACJ72_06937 [Emergomyces africanus]|uniref:Uncharacterized protein n=1 Tax=Emergomyces africanus TaxID=1955775 RepID=A0A1B7NPL2_9EURO|nr:hypothetical protein ACJ72_06937 [Emergomyces africanus]